jgi:hypothetical protein
MHIARTGARSKMECVFFPPPRFFNSKLPLSIAHSPDGCDADNELTYGDDVLSENNCQRENAMRHWREREEVLYNELKKPNQSTSMMAMSLSVGTSNILAPTFPLA